MSQKDAEDILRQAIEAENAKDLDLAFGLYEASLGMWVLTPM